MLTLQKGVRSALVGTSHIPDWFSQGIQKKTLVTSFSVNAGNFSLSFMPCTEVMYQFFI